MKMICLGEEQKVSFFVTLSRSPGRTQFVHTAVPSLNSRAVCYGKNWLGHRALNAAECAPPFDVFHFVFPGDWPSRYRRGSR